MGSIAEFKSLMATDFDSAMKTYFFLVDPSLDGKIENNKFVERYAFEERDVVFEFCKPNVIKMRAKRQDEAADSRCWYLPWVPQGMSKATLDSKGPPYFSTSQLTGCRFTIRYAGADRKKVTVLHLAGDVSYQQRDVLEKPEIGADAKPALVRRYSLGQHPKPKGDPTRIYYDGNQAWIFGYRDDNGAWSFVAQQMDFRNERGKQGLGIKEL